MNYEQTTEIENLNRIFQLQKATSSPSNAPSYEQRFDRLSRIERLCKDNVREISEALEKDFGSRNPDVTFLADIYPQLSHAKHAKSHLKE